MQEFNTLYKDKKIERYIGSVRCSAHIINIVAQTLLKKLNTEVFDEDFIIFIINTRQNRLTIKPSKLFLIKYPIINI